MSDDHDEIRDLSKLIAYLRALEPAMSEEHRAELQGALSDEDFAHIEWWRLGWWTRQYVEADLDTDWAVSQSMAVEEDGKDRAPMEILPFDEDGFALIRPAGFDGSMLRLHYSRLMPGAPLE